MKIQMLSAFLLLGLSGLVSCDSNDDSETIVASDQDVTISFQAVAGQQSIACGASLNNLGAGGRVCSSPRL